MCKIYVIIHHILWKLILVTKHPLSQTTFVKLGKKFFLCLNLTKCDNTEHHISKETDLSWPSYYPDI